MTAILRSTGIALLAAWLVSLGANVVVGQGDTVDARYAAMGALPATPAPLGDLRLPARDPFAADVVAATPAPAPSDPRIDAPSDASLAQHPREIGEQSVPDVAAFATNAAVAVIGVIVGAVESYALVEDGNAVTVVHVGDRVAGVRVSAIGPGGVDLDNGTHFGVDDLRRSAAPAPSAVPAPDVAPPISTAPRVWTRPTVPPGVERPPTPAAAIVPPPIGTPALTRPDGTTVTPAPLPSGLRPGPSAAVSAFPTFAPLFSTPPPFGSAAR